MRLTVILTLLLVTGCARDVVTLLPNADGRSSVVTVSSDKGSQTLDEPYKVAEVMRGAVVPTKTTPKEVEKEYGKVLSSSPVRPRTFILYFVSGGVELTPESKSQIPVIKAELEKLPAGEAIVTGHTDSVGDGLGNDRLSLSRAEATKDLLIQAGFKAEQITTAGRGEREPVVKTVDEVDEPKNRRVEIKIR